MSEIKVGEYVRTKDGIIDRTERYSYNCNVWHCKNGMCIDECETVGTPISDITKHSKNIINLIEVGDAIKYKELRCFSNYETTFNKEYILGIHNAIELKNMKKRSKK